MTSYHGWTHAPKAQGGTDPIPGQQVGQFPWIALSDGATTAPDDTIMPIPFSTITYDPSLVTQGEIFDWAITDSGDVGIDRFVIESQPLGWYQYLLVTAWDQVTTPGGEEHGLAQQRITWNPALNSPFGDNDHRWSADWNDPSLAPNFFEMIDNPYLRGYGKVFIGPAGGGGGNPREWILRAIQRTGASRGLTGVLFLLEYLGLDDSTGWTIDTV